MSASAYAQGTGTHWFGWGGGPYYGYDAIELVTEAFVFNYGGMGECSPSVDPPLMVSPPVSGLSLWREGVYNAAETCLLADGFNGMRTNERYYVYSHQCDSGYYYDEILHVCSDTPPPVDPCVALQGTLASSGVFGGFTSASELFSATCYNGCEVEAGDYNPPHTYPDSPNPDLMYFQANFFYTATSQSCTSEPIPSPTTPPTGNPPLPEEEGNGNCPNGWTKQADGSCTPIADPSDPLNGGDAGNCPAGSYWVADLGICLLYNTPQPATPTGDGTPTGGGEGDEPAEGGSDGTGTNAEESGIDTDDDGQTNDEGFCTQYPDSPICKISSHVDKGCGTAPACSGDAIQCAIDKKLWALNCSRVAVDKNIATTASDTKLILDKTTEIKDLLDVDLSGVGTDAFSNYDLTSELTAAKLELTTAINAIKTQASAVFNANISGGGSLPSGSTVLKFGSFDLSASATMPKFQNLGNVIFAVSGLYALFILLRKT